MGRPSKPWRRKGRGGWWAKVDGKATWLADTERRAWVELHRLLGHPRGSGPRLTVLDLVDLWLDRTKRHVKPVTWRYYRIYGESFAHRWGKLLAADIREHHVDAWLDGQATWDGCRPLAATVVRMCWRWGRRKGHMATNELAEMRGDGIRAREPAPAGAVAALADGFLSDEFADLYRFMVAVGCRPGEARTLTADRIDLDARLVVVDGKKGLRPIVLPDAAMGPLRRALGRHPAGYVFRSSTGKPWGMSGLASQVRAARRRLDLGEDVVAYHARGDWAARAHAAGVDGATIAVSLGHSDTSRLAVLLKHYLRIDHARLLEAAESANREGGRDEPGAEEDPESLRGAAGRASARPDAPGESPHRTDTPPRKPGRGKP